MDNLTATKQAIAEISKSINSIDNVEKTIAVQKIIEAVNVAAGNNRVAAVSGATGGSTPAGGTVIPNGTEFKVNVDLAGRTIDTYLYKFMNGMLGRM